MNVNSGKVNLYLVSTKKVPDIVIGLSFKSDANDNTLNIMKTGLCVEEAAQVDCSALCYALYLNVDQRLTGSAKEVSKSKVGKVNCSANNGLFNISWTTQGTGSSLRKSLGEALKALNPAKMFSSYKSIKQSLGHKVKREEFNYVTDELIKSMKIDVCVVGKINIKKDKLNDVIKTAVSKFYLDKADSPKNKPVMKKDEHKCENLIKCGGIDSEILLDYLKNNSIHARKCSGGVEVLSDGWHSKHQKLKKSDKISKYVSQKYEKLNEHFVPIVSYVALRNGLDSVSVISFAKKNLKWSKMKDTLKKLL